VDAKFEEMLTDMNLTDESKRAPLRKKPIREKRQMLSMQYSRESRLVSFFRCSALYLFYYRRT